ncbi:MAG: hypothetical protein HYY44_03750 [Deltaproteobacteria bacterium]|nr:hypothetical protein [Deltaproteobacteria bacterium]
MIQNRGEFEKIEKKERELYLAHLSFQKSVEMVEELLGLASEFQSTTPRSDPVALSFLISNRSISPSK